MRSRRKIAAKTCLKEKKAILGSKVTICDVFMSILEELEMLQNIGFPHFQLFAQICCQNTQRGGFINSTCHWQNNPDGEMLIIMIVSETDIKTRLCHRMLQSQTWLPLLDGAA